MIVKLQSSRRFVSRSANDVVNDRSVCLGALPGCCHCGKSENIDLRGGFQPTLRLLLKCLATIKSM